jgi:hypothetical protein
MSKLVNWGRWLVAASIGFYIARGIYDDALYVFASMHAGRDWTYMIGVAARYSVLVALFVVVGWGILIWADWAHGLLTLLMTVGVGVVLYALFTGGRQALNWEVLGGLAIYSSTLLWLLLPAVRHRYWQKENNGESRLINWGRWLAVAFFAIEGADLFWSTMTSLPRILRQHPQEITYYFVWDTLFWIPTLMCAWGIFKWRRWARSLGIALSALDVLGLSIFCVTIFRSGAGLYAFWPLVTLIACFILVWLLLPVVRMEYSRRNQIA